MRKVNSDRIEPRLFRSPQGRYQAQTRSLSEALGRDPNATDLNARHPFDVSIVRIPPSSARCPYHSHSAQWEFYHVIAGSGITRDEEGRHRIEAGDAFIYRPGEAHQIINDGTIDLVYYCIADNPIGESCHYPDSGKWLVTSPERRVMRGEATDYFDGEE